MDHQGKNVHINTPKLLPCPFCGHDTPEFARTGTPRRSCIVICGNCGCQHESSDEGHNSGKSWNERAVIGQLREGGEPVADERTEFVAWLTSTYPDAYSEPEAVRLWHHEHVAALAWEERGRRAVLADRQQRAPLASEDENDA